MPTEHASMHCPRCQAQVACVRSVPNHLVHALATLFLCGFWLPIWIIVSLSEQTFRCTRCGTAEQSAAPQGHGLAVAIGAGLVLLALLLLVAYVASR